MLNLFMILFLISIFCLALGIIKPSLVIKWGNSSNKTRRNVFKYFGSTILVLFILICIVSPKAQTETAQAQSKQEEIDEFESASVEEEVVQAEETKKTGWIEENGNWFYYDNDGKIKTGWQNVNGNSYHFNNSGVMDKGWIKDNGKDYYLDNSGVMQTGWKESNGKWYYLNSNGSMATNTTIDGYEVSSSGVMQEKEVSRQANDAGNNNISSNSNSVSSTSNNDDVTTCEPAQGNRTVYWTSGGKSYHYNRNCRSLARSKNVSEGLASSCPKTDPCNNCVR